MRWFHWIVLALFWEIIFYKSPANQAMDSEKVESASIYKGLSGGVGYSIKIRQESIPFVPFPNLESPIIIGYEDALPMTVYHQFYNATDLKRLTLFNDGTFSLVDYYETKGTWEFEEDEIILNVVEKEVEDETKQEEDNNDDGTIALTGIVDITYFPPNATLVQKKHLQIDKKKFVNDLEEALEDSKYLLKVEELMFSLETIEQNTFLKFSPFKGQFISDVENLILYEKN